MTQVAASLALLFSAGLLLQTFRRLTQVKPGFEPSGAITFHVFTPGARYQTPKDIDRYFDDAAASLRGIPGARDVSTTTLLPFGGGRYYDVFIQEERGDQGPNNPATAVSTNTPGFERALGIPILRGRSFIRQDDSTSEPVVMINDVIAKRNYSGQDPVGRFIKWNAKDHWRIVGVVGSIHLNSLSDELMPILYVPESQAPRRSRYFIVRADAPADQVVAAARGILRAYGPDHRAHRRRDDGSAIERRSVRSAFARH